MRQTVARLMLWAWASLRIVAAISSSVQPLAGRSWLAVVLLAIDTTAIRWSGGKAPGPAGARGILESLQAACDEAFAPLADGMAVTVQFGGDVLVGRVVRLGGAQDDAAAKGERLGGGPGADEGFESVATIGIQFDHRGEGARHGSPPGEQDTAVTLRDMMPTAPRSARRLAADLRNSHLVSRHFVLFPPRLPINRAY